MLLPDLADIFDITIDELFRDEKEQKYELEVGLYTLGGARLTPRPPPSCISAQKT
jgi:hypothetical protein